MTVIDRNIYIIATHAIKRTAHMCMTFVGPLLFKMVAGISAFIIKSGQPPDKATVSLSVVRID